MAHRSRLAFVSALALALALAACGDAARDGSFQGASLLPLPTTLISSALVATDGPLRATLAWLPYDGIAAARRADATDTSPTANEPFVIDVLGAPDATHLRAEVDIEGDLAIGQVVAYVDRDGDGRFDPGLEPIIGSDAGLVVFSRAGARSPTLGVVPPGFHRHLASPCGGTPPLLGPELPRDTVGALVIGPKGLPLYTLHCLGPPSPCADLEALRAVCWHDPDDVRCAECPGAVWPAGATPEACEAWYGVCVERYEAAQCITQRAACVAGTPPCDRACGCRMNYDACMGADDPAPEVCDAKLASCLGPRSP